MGNYEQLKDAVTAVIKANGKKEITGQILQDTLLAMINSLGSGAVFGGIATPATKPGTPDQNIFYIAGQNGTYANFGGAILKNEVAIFTIKNGTWTKETLVNILDASQGNRALYVAAGAVYNEQTGFYELNGLTNITENQMLEIYKFYYPILLDDSITAFAGFTGRTNFPFKVNPGGWVVSLKCDYLCVNAINLEVFNVGVENVTVNYIIPQNMIGMFYRCVKLHTILGEIRVNNVTNFNNSFSSCSALVNFKIKFIKQSISFSDSPLISLESLQYLITNAANTSPITVTVHADVYAKIQDESQADWHALIALAQEKRITFATA